MMQLAFNGPTIIGDQTQAEEVDHETTHSSGLDSYPVWLRTREQRQDLRTASDLRSGRFEAFVSFPSGDDVAGPTKSLVQSPRAAESLIEESISKIGPGCAVLTTE